MAVALGVSLAGEAVEPILADVLSLAGRRPLAYPVSGNLGGKTAAAVSYAAPHDLGHYVVFNQEGSRHQYTCFLAGVGTDAGAVIPAAAALDAPCR